MHLMEVASGYCLQSGVTGATGGLTLQPRCNVPNDSKVPPPFPFAQSMQNLARLQNLSTKTT